MGKYLNEKLDEKKHVYVSFKTVFTKPKTKNINKKADRTHAYELKYMSETTEPCWGCTHYQILEDGKVQTIADVDLRLNRISESRYYKFQLRDKISDDYLEDGFPNRIKKGLLWEISPSKQSHMHIQHKQVKGTVETVVFTYGELTYS